jgi:hypothetical protein
MTDPVRFPADRGAYVRSNTKLAALCMAGAMAVLWLIGDPNIWVGAVAGLAAIALRAWYLASEDLAAVWEITGDALIGPQGRHVPLDQIETLRSMASFVQVVTRDGHKHLIKYQADPAATIAAIERARS